MFQTFTLETIAVPEGNLRVRHGGSGPPLLLVHGHPRTHTTWWRVAPLLAEHFTVICPDLPGFGRSYQPAEAPDHANSSKRAKAKALVALMRRLGHRRFAVAGHDRGAYAAFRLAMDHPDRVTRLAILDAVPIGEALARCDARFAASWWHWFFFAVADKPERAILADPVAWYGGSAEAMGSDNHADFLAAIRDPAVVQGMLEDYRAGLGIDRAHDDADRAAGRRLACPLLVLWSLKDDLEALYGDVVGIWRPWVGGDLSGHGIDSGHHMAEEAPEQLAAALKAHFLG
ncbi:alpha/beta fold hydrolase [Faunimonas sp. B44]|uniref:alpha/beta fold hydrolase n=1 Tax=Faunimonas sp. B44 TaxID=3461493 RepID=UPI004044C8E8